MTIIKFQKIMKKTFPQEEIPRNKMIHYLENLCGKKQKVIADLGCGYAEINILKTIHVLYFIILTIIQIMNLLYQET